MTVEVKRNGWAQEQAVSPGADVAARGGWVVGGHPPPGRGNAPIVMPVIKTESRMARAASAVGHVGMTLPEGGQAELSVE